MDIGTAIEQRPTLFIAGAIGIGLAIYFVGKGNLLNTKPAATQPNYVPIASDTPTSVNQAPGTDYVSNEQLLTYGNQLRNDIMQEILNGVGNGDYQPGSAQIQSDRALAAALGQAGQS